MNGEKDLDVYGLLFASDTVLPGQFFPDPLVADTGVWKLMRAVLEDGIVCYKKYKNQEGRRSQRLFREAETWILSNDCGWLYAFKNICDLLGYDAVAVREALAENHLPQEKRPRHIVGRRVKLS